MDILKLVSINEKLEVNDLLSILENGHNIQLCFPSLDDFNNFFPKFSELLYEHVFQIKSLYCPSTGQIFEDSVKIISQIEDILETEIRHIVIENQFSDDIKQLCEFYFDDLQDGSLSIGIFDHSNPIETVVSIERNRYQGVSLAAPLFVFNEPIVSKALGKYTNAVYYFSDLELTAYETINGYYIKVD